MTSLVKKPSSGATDLVQLRSTIGSGTTLSQAQADYAQTSSGNRVYYLVPPVAHLVVNAGSTTSVPIPGLNTFVASVQLLASASNQPVLHPVLHPAPQAVLHPFVADLQAQVATTGTTNTSGPSVQPLAYAPAQYDANRNLLSPAAAAVATTNSAIDQASHDARAIARYLRHQSYLRGQSYLRHQRSGHQRYLRDQRSGHPFAPALPAPSALARSFPGSRPARACPVDRPVTPLGSVPSPARTERRCWARQHNERTQEPPALALPPGALLCGRRPSRPGAEPERAPAPSSHKTTGAPTRRPSSDNATGAPAKATWL